MNLNEILITKGIILLFGKSDQKIQKIIHPILQNYKNKQILIVDVNRTWQPNLEDTRIRYIRPESKEKIIEIISELDQFITPRLSLIIIDGVINFLRDYIGRSPKDAVLNQRYYSYILNSLTKIVSEYNIKIIITSNQSGYDIDKPIYDEVNSYFKLHRIKL